MLLYHLLSTEHALSNIALQRIKVSRFRDLNDPFELQAVNVGGRKDFRRRLREWKEQLNERKGLLCFSQHWKNPVLWSHYADKHRGMCLGYEIDSKLVQSVEYVPERVKYAFDERRSIDADPKLVEILMRTKYVHWEYESERRAFVDLADHPQEDRLYFRYLGAGIELKEVVIGSLCDVPFEKVLSLMQSGHAPVKITKSRLAFKWFEIVKNKSVP